MTVDDILDAIRADIELRKSVTDEGATGPEIARGMGCSTLTARDHIRRLLEAGRMEVVQLERRRIDGRTARVAGYRLKA